MKEQKSRRITRKEYRRTGSGEEKELQYKDGAGGVERKGHIDRGNIRGA
jgi:hypothetical protein